MKAVLIALNCLFALGITWGILSDLGKPSVDEDEYFIKRKPGKKTTVRKTNTKKGAVASRGPAKRESAEIEQIIVEKNIFNPARCPNARVFGRRTGGNARLNLTLVGTFTIDNVSGAIILQRQQAQQNRMMMMNQPWMMGRAMMMNQNNNNRFRQRFMPGMFPGMQNNNNNNYRRIIPYPHPCQGIRVADDLWSGDMRKLPRKLPRPFNFSTAAGTAAETDPGCAARGHSPASIHPRSKSRQDWQWRSGESPKRNKRWQFQNTRNRSVEDDASVWCNKLTK